jgi:phosphate transport system substrate-binding protein
MTMIKPIWSALIVGCILLEGISSFAFDTTKPQWPQLSTSHGPIKPAETIKDEIDGDADFLLTDIPLTDAELQHARNARGLRLLHIATAVTAVVPCYNVGGIKQPLNFSSDTLAAIFLGKITKWNDPAILEMNPASHVPNADIIVVGHALEDGSTYAWTDFLTKTNLDWRRSVGRVRSLMGIPVMARGRSQDELAELVQRTPNSMSYLELWAAKHDDLQVGRVKNRSSQYVDPSPASVGAAARTASAAIRDDFRASITDTDGQEDYPIASFTWAVIPDKFHDSEKRTVLVLRR